MDHSFAEDEQNGEEKYFGGQTENSDATDDTKKPSDQLVNRREFFKGAGAAALAAAAGGGLMREVDNRLLPESFQRTAAEVFKEHEIEHFLPTFLLMQALISQYDLEWDALAEHLTIEVGSFLDVLWHLGNSLISGDKNPSVDAGVLAKVPPDLAQMFSNRFTYSVNDLKGFAPRSLVERAKQEDRTVEVLVDNSLQRLLDRLHLSTSFSEDEFMFLRIVLRSFSKIFPSLTQSLGSLGQLSILHQKKTESETVPLVQRALRSDSGLESVLGKLELGGFDYESIVVFISDLMKLALESVLQNWQTPEVMQTLTPSEMALLANSFLLDATNELPRQVLTAAQRDLSSGARLPQVTDYFHPYQLQALRAMAVSEIDHDFLTEFDIGRKYKLYEEFRRETFIEMMRDPLGFRYLDTICDPRNGNVHDVFWKEDERKVLLVSSKYDEDASRFDKGILGIVPEIDGELSANRLSIISSESFGRVLAVDNQEIETHWNDMHPATLKNKTLSDGRQIFWLQQGYDSSAGFIFGFYTSQDSIPNDEDVSHISTYALIEDLSMNMVRVLAPKLNQQTLHLQEVRERSYKSIRIFPENGSLRIVEIDGVDEYNIELVESIHTQTALKMLESFVDAEWRASLETKFITDDGHATGLLKIDTTKSTSTTWFRTEIPITYKINWDKTN